MKEYKFCQSCGMPKSKDKGNGGTEKDGTKSKKYCSYCYVDGEFFMADEINTAKDMQKMCIQNDEGRRDEWNLCLVND